MKKIKSFLKFIAPVIVILVALQFSLVQAEVTTNFWANLAGQGLVTNAGNGYANSDIHVAHCYIGLGTGTPCGSIGSSVRLNTILAANGTNDINSANFGQIWRWNSLTAGPAFTLSSNSTANSTGSRILDINNSGANASASVVSSGLIVTVNKTGTTNSNIGGQFLTSGGSLQNYGTYSTATGPANSSNYAVYGQASGTSSTNYGSYLIASGSTSTNIGIISQVSGGTANYAGIFLGGNVGVGTQTPASKITINTPGIGTTQSDTNGLLLANSSGAAAGAQQISPAIVWQGNGWRTSAGGSSRDVRWRADILPTQAPLTPQSSWLLSSSTDGGTTYVNHLSVSGTGLTTYGDPTLPTFGTINGVILWATNNMLVAGTQYATTMAGSFSTGYGSNVLASLTSGQYNTAIGFQAMGALTTGGINTGIGANALQHQTTGISNTAVGVNSLLTSTTGFQNSAVGGGAMENLTTGQENSCIGYDCGLNATTAIRNVWLGWNAKSGTDGMQNVVAGYASGVSLTAGNQNNVFIGAFSGNNVSQRGNALNTVAIGASSFTTADNQVVLGNSSMTQNIFWGALMPNNLPGTSGQILTSQGSGTSPIWSDGPLTLASGTYTPTLSNTTNVTSSTPIVCHYTRVGDQVTVTGSAGVVTTLAVTTVLGISLPIASELAVTTDLAGVGQASSAIAANAYVEANTTTNIAELKFTGLSVGGSGTIFFTFTYSVQLP